MPITPEKEYLTEREMMSKLQELLNDKEKAKTVEQALEILKETKFDGLSYQFREFLWAVRRLAAGECLHLQQTYIGVTQFKIGYKCDKCGEEIWTND